MFARFLNRKHLWNTQWTVWNVKQLLQTRQVREKLHNQLGILGQKYVNMLLDSDREKAIDHIYNVYLSKNGTMLGDKYFDVDINDFDCRWSKV